MSDSKDGAATKSARLETIDQARGISVVLMVLLHTL